VSSSSSSSHTFASYLSAAAGELESKKKCQVLLWVCKILRRVSCRLLMWPCFLALLVLCCCSTSHEISKVSVLDQEAYRPLMANVQDAINHHRQNALNPAHPHQRGTSQGPDIYFQMLEAANKYYLVRAVYYQHFCTCCSR
jgi:hypothetical protein